MLKKMTCLLAFAMMLLSRTAALGESAPEIVIDRGVAMTTRDGIKLLADIYCPAGEGNFPVLLTRTPYDKDGDADFARNGAARGHMGSMAFWHGFMGPRAVMSLGFLRR